MNEFGCIDYKQPFGTQHDYRTSYYMGHFQRDKPQVVRNAPPLANVCTRFPPADDPLPPSLSEQQYEYILKYPDPYVQKNPTLSKPQFMKAFDECRVRYPPKPLSQLLSTTASCHDWKIKPEEITITVDRMPNAVPPNKSMQINRFKPGYAKYLDSSATTNNLAHPEYSLNDLGIGSKDQITFYNWKKYKYNVFKIKQPLCEKYASDECPKRRREFRSLVKAVPNAGQMSEFKAAFSVGRSPLVFDLTNLNTKLISCSVPIPKLESSNSMYGKGKRTESYI